MTRELSFKREAEDDIAEAFTWYQAQSEDLGVGFLRALDAALANIRRNPLGYQIIRGSARRALMRRFPYGGVFEVRSHDVVIVACYHASRDPARWQQRIG